MAEPSRRQGRCAVYEDLKRDGEKRTGRQGCLVAENRLNSLKWEDEVLRQKHLEVGSTG